MQIKQLKQAIGPLWQSAMSIYCQVFPDWEREPVEALQHAVDDASSRCVVLYEGDCVYAVSLTELYPQHEFALLGYLFIAPERQGQGLGKQLCNELFAFFQQQQDLTWLLVEAETGPEAFYHKLGFSRFNIDYLSPHYDDMGSTPMALMSLSKAPNSLPSPQQLWDLVEHIFVQSYYLSSTDPRLNHQRDNILNKEAL